MDRLVDFLLNFYGPTPYFIVFGVLLACGFGMPIPEDITLFAAGLAAYYGLVNLPLMIGVAYLGVMLGDSMIFWLGSHYGRRLLTRNAFFRRVLPEDRLVRVQEMIHRRGTKLLFFARFMPGFRAPVYFTAGTLHVPFKTFLFYDGLAATLSVPAIIWAVYAFGDELDRVVRIIQKIEHGILLVIAVLILAGVSKWYFTRRKLARSR